MLHYLFSFSLCFFLSFFPHFNFTLDVFFFLCLCFFISFFPHFNVTLLDFFLSMFLYLFLSILQCYIRCFFSLFMLLYLFLSTLRCFITCFFFLSVYVSLCPSFHTSMLHSMFSETYLLCMLILVSLPFFLSLHI